MLGQDLAFFAIQSYAANLAHINFVEILFKRTFADGSFLALEQACLQKSFVLEVAFLLNNVVTSVQLVHSLVKIAENVLINFASVSL